MLVSNFNIMRSEDADVRLTETGTKMYGFGKRNPLEVNTWYGKNLIQIIKV